MNMEDITIKVDIVLGSDIPTSAIPQMVRLANKVGCAVESKLNGVVVVAYPNDDPLDLAVAWRMALSSKNPHKMAFARHGRELMAAQEKAQ